MEKKFEAAWKEFSHACFAVVFSCNITTRDKGIELRSPNKKFEILGEAFHMQVLQQCSRVTLPQRQRLPSHVFFLNLVKGNYNIEPSLSIYFPSTPCVAKNTKGVTDKKIGGLRGVNTGGLRILPAVNFTLKTLNY
jgi:hypothetical protein